MAVSKNERPPRDLSVPETMKIAALLAELMPPSTSGSRSGEIPLHAGFVETGEETAGPLLRSALLEIEELDDVEPVAEPLPMRMRPSAQARTMMPEPQGLVKSNFPVEFPTPPPMARVRLPEVESPVSPPLPEPIRVASEFLDLSSWKSDPEPTPIHEPVVVAQPLVAAADPELIPLGDLSTAGFFSLVNWRNDPAKVRHPRRADYGLDQQTLALARRNPFYALGQPRRPETRTVAEVLAEFVWE